MSSEKHPNLQLHKWAPTDYVKREEWNENFGIIDDKIGILNKIVMSPLQFKNPSDPDDTNAFRTMIQTAIDMGVRKLVVPHGTYYLSKIIWLNGASDFEIDLQNSTIVWNGQDQVTPTRDIRYYGVFSAIAEDIPYPTHPILSWEQELYFKNNIIPEPNFAGNTFKCSKITIDDASDFQKGDYIRLRIGNPLNSGNNDYQNVFKPTLDIVCKVLHVVGNDLYVDYYSPYDFSQVDITAVGTVKKINTIRNITIKNVFIHDVSPFAAPPGNQGDNPNRLKLVSGIGFHYAVNCKVENVRGLGMKLPLIMAQSCYGIECKNILNEYPESHGGGEGYAIHFEWCMKCHVFDVQGNDGNSVVDFSGCAFCSGTRIKSTNTYSYKTIGTHGEAEHDIIFRDCEGAFGFSNSTQWFACMAMNITLENCKGSIAAPPDGYLDIVIKDGDFRIKSDEKLYFRRLVLDNTKLTVGYQVDFRGHQRGINVPSIVEMRNGTRIRCEDDLSGLTTRMKFFNLDTVNINDCDIDFTGYGGKMSFENVKNINISSNLKNVPIVLYNRDGTLNKVNMNISPKVVLIDNQISYDRFLELDVLKYGNIFVNITGGIVNYLADSDFDFIKFNNETNKQDVNLYVNIVGVTFYSQYQNRLKVSWSNDSYPSKNYTKTQNVVGVVAVGAYLFGKDWNFAINKDISKTSMSISGFMYTTGLASGSIVPSQKGIIALSDVERIFLSKGTGNVYDWLELAKIQYGSTANRPTSRQIGTMYFDTDLNKPIWWTNAGWRDAMGNIV